MFGEGRDRSEFAAVVIREREIERPTGGSLEARASLALKLMAGVNTAGVVLAMFSPLEPVSTLLAVTFNSAAAVLAVLYVIAARAIDRRRPWAIAAVRPILVLLAVSGAYALLVAFTGGTPRVPFDGLLAIWALLAPADRSLVGGDVRRGALAAVTTGALLASMALATPLFGWGGLLDVHESDLRASISVDCGRSGPDMPQTVTVSYEWHWTSTSPMPNESDIVVIGWTGDDPQGRPLYVIDEIPESGAGIYAGLAGYPSTAMADLVGRESDAAYRWVIRLNERGYEPGRVTLQLMRPREDPPGPNTVTLLGSYVHLGLWRTSSPATCTW